MSSIEQLPAKDDTHWSWKSRHWTDWVGAAWGICAAVTILIRSPQWALLLLPAFVHGILVFAGFMLRGGAQRTFPGWRAQLAAYGGGFLVVTFIQAAVIWWPHWLAPSGSGDLRALGAGLYVIGITFGLWPLWWLRRSFSIVPAARRLVTTGPYRFARHPIYTMYFLQYLGFWLMHMTLPFTLVLVAWFTLMMLRIRYEEAVLTAAFPEYSRYRQRVGAFGPRLRGAVAAGNQPAVFALAAAANREGRNDE